MSTEPFRWHYDYTRILWDAGFCFNNQKSLKAFDRNGIALLDIERIIRERDTRIVEHHIQNILEYTLDAEEARILDPNFVKLFRLSQLAVEYLNYCKKYLDETTDTLKQELQKANEENYDLKQDILNYQLEVSKLKKKVKDLKSTLHIHQKYHPNGGQHLQGPVGTFRCNECRKGFLNAEYLKKHFLKRHPDSGEIEILETKIEIREEHSEISSSPVHTQYKAETDKLQMEIKELKEKLNSTERFFQNKSETVFTIEQAKDENQESKTQSEEYYKHVEELHHQFELLKTQIESEMQLLKTQKIEQDKYEELMEKFFHKLDERKEETEDEAQINEPSGSKVVAEISVQTVEEIIPNKEVQVEPTKNTEVIESNEKVKNISPKKLVQVSESSTGSRSEPVDVAKLKEEVEKDLEEKSKQNIDKLGKQISENITSTFNVLQERLETFWNKLQEIEVDREKQQQIIIHKPPLQTDREKQRIVIHKTPTQIEREKQRIIIQRPPPNIESTSSKKTEEIIKVPSQIIQSNEVLNMSNQSSDDDSDTESSKNNKVIEIPKQQSVLKSVQKNDKIARNLIAELKTKVEERNSSMLAESKKSPEKPKSILVEKPTVQQIYSKTVLPESSSEEESETETESESESVTETPVIVKPSKTTTASSSRTQRPKTNTTEGGRSTNTGISTLQNRSISSLENALRSNPDILIQLRDDMKDIVASRLKDLGIDPEWTRIPDKTYKQNLDIVTHHRSLAVKSVKSFMDIRSEILENLEDQVNNLKRRDSRDLTTPEPEQRPSRFKSLLINMRDKAKSIIKTERAPTPTTPIYKLTLHHSSPSIQQSPEKPKENLKFKPLGAKNLKTKPLVPAPAMYDTDSEDESETAEYHPTTPVRNIKTKTVHSTKKGLRKSRSESSMEVVEFSDQGTENPKTTSITNLARSLDSIVEMKRELASQLKKTEEKIYSSLDTIDNAKDEVIAVSPREKLDDSGDANFIQKIIQAEKGKLDISSELDSDELKEDEKIQRSVLKHMASTSASVKKKVLFDLHSENTKTSEIIEETKPEKTVVKKTIVKSNSLFKTNDWNDSSTSIDSSILDLKKVPKHLSRGQGDTISTKAVINVSTKQNKAQDDASDWEISDIN